MIDVFDERVNHAAILTASNPVPVPLSIRRVAAADLPYVRGSFTEGHKGAPGVLSMTWRYYKRFIVPILDSVLVRDGTELLGAYAPDGTIVGWLAFARGRRVATVHWVHTRWRIGEGPELRRHGIMTALFDHAALGLRIAYTFKGAFPRHRSGQTLDEKLLPWLSSRGQHAAYVPWEEWSL